MVDLEIARLLKDASETDIVQLLQAPEFASSIMNNNNGNNAGSSALRADPSAFSSSATRGLLSSTLAAGKAGEMRIILDAMSETISARDNNINNNRDMF